MPSLGSVTNWLNEIRQGDEFAAQRLWERYYERLVSLAAKKLGALPRRSADEEDVASTAFAQFFRGVQEGRFPDLHDRNNLWQILVMLTDRRAIDQLRRDGRRRDLEIGESGVHEPAADEFDAAGLDRFAGQDPTPEFIVQMIEDVRQLLNALDDESLRQLALWKLEGYSNEEIAVRVGKVPRTVERKLHLIRVRWLELSGQPVA